jgi:hypothetical protein
MKARLVTKMTTLPVSRRACFASVVLSEDCGSDRRLRLTARFGFKEISSSLRCADRHSRSSERASGRASAHRHGRLSKGQRQTAETRKRKTSSRRPGTKTGTSRRRQAPGPGLPCASPRLCGSRRLRRRCGGHGRPARPGLGWATATPGIPVELVAAASLTPAVINDPPVQCHLIAPYPAFLPAESGSMCLAGAVRGSRHPILRLVHMLAERRARPISLRDVAAGPVAEAGIPGSIGMSGDSLSRSAISSFAGRPVTRRTIS